MTDPTPDAGRLERLLGAYRGALEAGRMEEAETAVLEFLALAAQAPVEPTPESLLRDEAERREAAADWAGAEVTYRRMLAQARAANDDYTQFRSHEHLATLHGLLGRHAAALEEARAAVAAGRRADLPTLLFMALNGQALCALRTGRVPEALAAASEALQRMEGGALYDLQRGSALALRGACRAALGEWPAAERDLGASWGLVQPQAALAFAAGVHGLLARWWAITARLRAAQGDGGRAVEAWQEAVDRLRHLAQLPQASGPYAQSALARALHGLGHALAAQGPPDPAAEALAESRSLRQAVGLPPFAADEPTL
jgi:tetratricopeptide (TPR) repeat protein